jgi:hypothetical protein
MKAKNWLVLLACVALLVTPIVTAQSIWTTTDVEFNIGQVVQFTLTLRGESGVVATDSGAATTGLEFNSTDGEDKIVHANVEGGSAQTDADAIFNYDNTGTVNLNISVFLNATTPACIALYGGTTNETDTQLTTSVTEVVNDFTPAATAVDYWLRTNFTACTAGDTTTRQITSNGTQTT